MEEKLYTLLCKACYDLHMKIKRGRQILSAAQKIPSLIGCRNGYGVLVKHATHKACVKIDSPSQHALNPPPYL